MFKHDLEELHDLSLEIAGTLSIFTRNSWRIKHVRGGGDNAVLMFDTLRTAMTNKRWRVQTSNRRRQGGTAGWCSRYLQEIYVKPTYKNAMFVNLVHESAHAYDFDTYGSVFLPIFGHFAAEVRAESVAYLVAKYCGIGVNHGLLARSADYLANQYETNGSDYDDRTFEDNRSDIIRITEQTLIAMGF